MPKRPNLLFGRKEKRPNIMFGRKRGQIGVEIVNLHLLYDFHYDL